MGRLRHRLENLETPAMLQRGNARAGGRDLGRIDVGEDHARLGAAFAMTRPHGSTTSECPNVARPFSWSPPCAAANTNEPFSIARARISTCQCASPVCRVNAEGIARNVAPASASAR
jgi:hypothetical protein